MSGRVLSLEALASASVLAAASLLCPAARADDGPAPSVPPRFTAISAFGAGMAGQPRGGFWRLTSRNGSAGAAWGQGGSTLVRLTLRDGRLLMHLGTDAPWDESLRADTRQLASAGTGVIAQMTPEGACYRGLARTAELRIPGVPPRCPQYRWWSRSRLCFAPGGLAGEETISAFEHDRADCQLDANRPQQLASTIERFQGAAFVPVHAGRLIHLAAVAAPARYAARVQLAWDYRPLAQRAPAARVQVLQGTRVVVDTRSDAGSHVASVDRPGRQAFEVVAFDAAGHELHRDRLLADLPGIPGLN